MDHERTPAVTSSVPQVPTAQSQTVQDTGSHPEGIQILVPSSGDSHSSNGVATRDARRETTSTEQPLLSAASEAYSTLRDAGRETSSAARHLLSAASEAYSTLRDAGRGTSSAEQHLLGAASEAYSTLRNSDANPLADFERVPPPPRAGSRDEHARGSSHRSGLLSGVRLPAVRPHNGIDWIVPLDEKDHTRRTIGERLAPTIANAVIERDKYAQKALLTGYALNIAIGMQVLLGALTTGLAAAVTSGKQAQVATSVLGGLATLVASYLARARGSGEPELSITRVKDLEQFLREARAFQLDHAHEYGSHKNGLDDRLDHLRRRFEEFLGNADGQRKLSPVGITTTQAVP